MSLVGESPSPAIWGGVQLHLLTLNGKWKWARSEFTTIDILVLTLISWGRLALGLLAGHAQTYRDPQTSAASHM